VTASITQRAIVAAHTAGHQLGRWDESADVHGAKILTVCRTCGAVLAVEHDAAGVVIVTGNASRMTCTQVQQKKARRIERLTKRMGAI